jgi:hypothetical protein
MRRIVSGRKRNLVRSRTKWLAGTGLLLLVVLTLSSCIEPEPIVPVPPTATPDSPPPTLAPRHTPVPIPEAREFPLPPPVRVGIERPADETCVQCHTDEQALKASMGTGAEQHGSISEGEDWAGEMPAAEERENLYLIQEVFFETVHGQYGCISCHGGTGDTRLKEVAHQGMISEPSNSDVCGGCHTDEVAADHNSLHANLAGYRTPQQMPMLEEMMENHCEACHTATCGQCHVSRPARLGGGLVAGHIFQNTEAMNSTCAGCHGSRIADEYKGHNGDLPGDVHWVEAQMLCTDCHLPSDFHGATDGSAHRYDGRPAPDCQDSGCHPGVAEDDGIDQHGDSHLKHLSCQACHSTTYKNCYGCHVGVEDGEAFFQVDPPQLAFKIGRNPIQDRYRPWKYVPVRHVPIARDSFAYYGSNLLLNFDALPTWKYATPHNIQRITPQTESCNSCHGKSDLFLTASDVALDEVAANLRGIVDEVPARIP